MYRSYLFTQTPSFHFSTTFSTQFLHLPNFQFPGINPIPGLTSLTQLIPSAKYHPMSPGITVNLVLEWESFRAARTALNNTFEAVRNVSRQHVDSIPRLCERALKLLQEGVLVEDYVLDHVPKLMTFLRECNCTLRWMMLHTAAPPNHKRCKQLHDTVMSHNVCVLLIV